MKLFDNLNYQDGKPLHISPREAYAYLQDEAILVDIRPEYEMNYRAFDAPKVYLMPFSSFKESYQMLPMEIPLIIADSVGIQSSKIAQFLIDQGYSQVAYLSGGVIAWEQSNLPLTKDLDYQLNGGCACMIRSKK